MISATRKQNGFSKRKIVLHSLKEIEALIAQLDEDPQPYRLRSLRVRGAGSPEEMIDADVERLRDTEGQQI